MLVKLNSLHVLVKFTEHNSTFFGGEGEGFDFSNFALSVLRLLTSSVGQTVRNMFHQGDPESDFAAVNYKKREKEESPFQHGKLILN